MLGGFGGRPLGCAQFVRSCSDLAPWLAGVWVFDGFPGACVRVGGVRVVAGPGVSGWVGAWAGGNAVCSRCFVVVVVVAADVCGCRPAGLGM